MSSVTQNYPEPFDHMQVKVTAGDQEGIIDVTVKDLITRESMQASIEFAEIEAKTILKAIRAYRRKNPDPIKALKENHL